MKRCSVLIGRLALAFVLLASGVIHLMGPYFFLESVFAYEILDVEVAPIASVFIVHLSIVLGLAVALSQLRVPAYVMAGFLFNGFFAVQLYAYVSEKQIACGCFGATDTEISPTSMAVPIVCFLACLLLFRFDRNCISVSNKN